MDAAAHIGRAASARAIGSLASQAYQELSRGDAEAAVEIEARAHAQVGPALVPLHGPQVVPSLNARFAAAP